MRRSRRRWIPTRTSSLIGTSTTWQDSTSTFASCTPRPRRRHVGAVGISASCAGYAASGSGSSSAVPAAQVDRVTSKRDRGRDVLLVSRLMYFDPRVGTLVPRLLDQPRPLALQRPQCPQGPGPLGLHPPRLQRL